MKRWMKRMLCMCAILIMYTCTYAMDQYTDLIKAIHMKDSDRVRELTNDTSLINKKGIGGATPLMIASKKGDVAVLRELLKANPNIDAFDSKGKTALMYAAEQGNKDAVQLLIQAGASVNALNTLKRTALLFALDNEKNDVALLLIAAGADVNIADIDHRTPLILAVQQLRQHINPDLSVVRALVIAGADVRAKDQDDKTAYNYDRKGYLKQIIEQEDALRKKAFYTYLMGEHDPQNPISRMPLEIQKEIYEYIKLRK